MRDQWTIYSMEARGEFVGEPMTMPLKSLARILGKPMRRRGKGRNEFSPWTGADEFAEAVFRKAGPRGRGQN